MMLPVVKALKPRSFINLFFGCPGCAVFKAVQVAQVREKLFRIVDVVNAKLKLVYVMRVQVDGGFLIRRKRPAGAEVKRDGAFCVYCLRGSDRRQQKKQRQDKSGTTQFPSRRMFHR